MGTDPAIANLPAEVQPDTPWDQDALDEQQPLIRRLLRYMVNRDRAHLSDLCPLVWETDYTNVNDGSIRNALSKANAFLGTQGEVKTLTKIRDEPMIKWQ